MVFLRIQDIICSIIVSGAVLGLRKDESYLNSWRASAPQTPPISWPKASFQSAGGTPSGIELGFVFSPPRAGILNHIDVFVTIEKVSNLSKSVAARLHMMSVDMLFRFVLAILAKCGLPKKHFSKLKKLNWKVKRKNKS